MKKRILVVMANILSLTAIGQLPPLVNQAPLYYNDWLLPEAFSTGCAMFPLPAYQYNGYILYGNNNFTTSMMAQPYFTDSIISIKGIVLIGRSFIRDSVYFADSAYYLQIRDSSLNNVLAQVRHDPMQQQRLHYPPIFNFYSGNNGGTYLELLFDNPVFVSSKFYTAITMPNHLAHYNWLYYSGGNSSYSYSDVNVLSKLCYEKPDGGEIESFSILINGNWTEYKPKYLDNNNYPAAAFIFPILDTTTPIETCQFNTTCLNDTADSIVTLTTTITESGYPKPITIGFVYDTNILNLNLSNPNVVTYTYPYDSNQNFYSFTLPYNSLICNVTYYYRTFVITPIDTIVSNIETFIKQCSNSIEMIDNDIFVILYPNPTDKEITIESAIPMQRIEISNAAGQIVFTIKPNKTKTIIDVSKFAKGNYIAKIYTNKGIIIKKLVME